MSKLQRLGLGCMGMSCRRNSENSIETIHKALDTGISGKGMRNFRFTNGQIII